MSFKKLTLGLLLASGCVATVFDPADFNHDGHVDGADLGILLGVWGPTQGSDADFSCDHSVTGADLGVVLGNWGSLCFEVVAMRSIRGGDGSGGGDGSDLEALMQYLGATTVDELVLSLERMPFEQMRTLLETFLEPN
jgi:hypothetical protein